MSGSSSSKGGYGQPTGYQSYGYGAPYQPNYGYQGGSPGGSFFSAGGSSRPGYGMNNGYGMNGFGAYGASPNGGGYGADMMGRIMDAGPLFGSPYTGGGYQQPQGYQQPTGAQIMAGGNPSQWPYLNAGNAASYAAGVPGAGGNYFGSGTLPGSSPTGAQIMGGGNPYNNQVSNSNFGGNPISRGSGPNITAPGGGATAAQQAMGITMTPQGTLSFGPSNPVQIPASTASLMGARNDGQGHWVNSQGQVVGLV